MRYYFTLFIMFLQSQMFAAKISGTFSATDTAKTLILTRMNYDTRTDSIEQRANVGAAKTFNFNITLTEPTLYNIATSSERVLLYLVVHPNDSIVLQIEGKKVSVSNSQETQYLLDYESNRLELYNKWLKPVYDSSKAAAKNHHKEKLEYWNKAQTDAMEQYKAGLSTWVLQPFFIESLAAIHHSMRFNPDKDVALMDSMVAVYKRKYPDYLLTRQLENKVSRFSKIAIGAIAPNFKSQNPKGDTIELSSIKGKYILLDFWASWCGPCRRESPTMVRIYNTYKDKGFTIISVSIDDSKEKWIKAIEKDHYTWTNLSDLAGWASPSCVLYSVSSIPGSFLLDADGRIIAKNLHGKDLENKLTELLK
jgi:peroxiredoxin